MSADTDLTAACQQGDLVKATTALDNGADPTLRGSMATPLAAACSHGLEDVVDMLLAHGAPADGNAFTFAKMNNHANIIAKLEAAQANPKPRIVAAPVLAAPPLFVAGGQGDLAVVQALLAEGADVNACAGSGASALIAAAGGGHPEVVQALLAGGARIDVVERRMGCNALLAAAINGDVACVEALLGAGLAAQAQNADGFTPLMYAASKGTAAVVSLLLTRGAQVDTVNKFNETALIRAASAGHTLVVQALLDAGAQLEAATQEQQTALMLAAHSGHLAVVQLLLARGADKQRASLALRTAGDYARLAGHDEVEALLKPPSRVIPKISPRVATPEEMDVAQRNLVNAIWSKNLDAAVQALEAGAQREGQGDDIPLLLAAGAKPSQEVVFAASIDRHPGIMKLLAR